MFARTFVCMGMAATGSLAKLADALGVPVRLHHFEKIADGINIAPLVAQLRSHPELWNSISLRKAALDSPPSEMNDIWVRYNEVKPYDERGDYMRPSSCFARCASSRPAIGAGGWCLAIRFSYGRSLTEAPGGG